MKKVPDFYNNLEEIKKEIHSLLIRGVKDRKSNFHNIVFNTINLVNQFEKLISVLHIQKEYRVQTLLLVLLLLSVYLKKILSF